MFYIVCHFCLTLIYSSWLFYDTASTRVGDIFTLLKEIQPEINRGLLHLHNIVYSPVRRRIKKSEKVGVLLIVIA